MVSIIIPYIDEHDYLAEAVASALGQLDVTTEIILVCNAPSIPEGYQPLPGLLKNIRWIHQPVPGSANARNAGLDIAAGEWIQFLDVDDLLHPDKIHHQLNHENGDVVVSPHTFLFLNGTRENSKWLPQDIWCGLLDSGLGSTSSMLWKRQALTDAGGWNQDWQSHQEYELLFRLASSGKIIMTNDHCETIVRQRKNGSITDTSKPVRALEGIRLREMMWDHLIRHKLDTPQRFEAFRQYIFRQLRGLFRQDRKLAMEIYKKYFSTSFTPKGIHVPGYSTLHRVCGFYTTEKMIGLIISMRSLVNRR